MTYTTLQIANTRILRRYWLTVPEKNVIRRLKRWRQKWDSEPHTCKTVACVGGWISAIPEFIEQGVYIGPEGVPYLKTGEFGAEVAAVLFGDRGLFRHRGGVSIDRSFTGSDHALALRRIDSLMVRQEAA